MKFRWSTCGLCSTLLLLILLCGCPTMFPSETQCGNGLDDDFDGVADCSDEDCLGVPPCDSIGDLTLISGGQLTRSFGATGTLLQNNSFVCTTTLVAENLVLTAAHCVTDEFGRTTSPGSLAYGIGVDPGDVDRVPIESVAVAPGWTGPSNIQAGNDLAVLRLQRSVTSIKPVLLSLSDPSGFVGQTMILVGYGRSFDEPMGGRDTCNSGDVVLHFTVNHYIVGTETIL